MALRTPAVAVRLGTFEAAARELHATPPPRIGGALLHRARPLEASEAGLVLVRLAAQIEDQRTRGR
ncbi:DNA-binding transcriptional LysR family regulator [Nocardioides cavernae]|uniref:DNA-binding transcriptional LysR family regulator n=1 Tax=Nocardioides cavernae TaxID=1921566 RepID=A0A7Y9H404_9ACTN|nr:hypothetical protein [Nocardioides cavernae]NYE37201.1 DNA-binding transcriptional LysR family regulator [Nocardioides cavernae]